MWEEIGDGQEAYVLEGKLTEIEGIGGIVKSAEPINVAKRVNWGKPVYDYEGHDLFCKHLALKILDEFFLREGKYSKEHIPTPLGSFNGGYYYKFVEGSEGFPLEIIDDEYRIVPVQIDEWNSFVGVFNSFGFSAGSDIADAVDGRTGKNAIFLPWNINEVYKTERLHSDWKRIDFGSTSCPFNYKEFLEEMGKREEELISKIGERYNLAFLSVKYSHLNDSITPDEFRELERLVLEYRKKQIAESS